MSGLIEINGEEIEVFTENSTSDVALSAFSGYMGFTGEMASQYGGTPGKVVGLVFDVSGGVITGVFDKNLNPKKEYDNVIGTALVGYGAGAFGAFAGRVVAGFIGGSVAGPVGAVVGAVLGGVLGGLYGDDIYNLGETFTSEFIEVLVENFSSGFEFTDTKIHGTVTQEEFILQSLENDPDFAKRMFPEYVRYRQITTIKNGISTLADFIKYNSATQEAEIKASTDSKAKDLVQTITSETSAEQLILNNVTFDIQQVNNLTVRNAIEEIPAVSFLLSHILIYSGEKLDLGDKGLYTIKAGDTLSTIAEANGYITKDLLLLNTWLVDEGRVTFDQDKVLIETDANDLANLDHTLTGDTNVENILKDFNGGDDTLIGGNLKDTMEGGEGFDTYIVNNGDIIDDSDNLGSIIFNETVLDGLKTKLTEAIDGIFVSSLDNAYEDANFVYEELGSMLIVTSKEDKTSKISIRNWDSQSKEGLNITLEHNPKDVKIRISDASVTEGADGTTGLMTFSISTSRVLLDGESITLDLNIADINTSSDDYGSLSANTVTLDKDNSTIEASLVINGDDISEGDEYFNLNATVSSQTGLDDAEIKVDAGVGTIVGDDGGGEIQEILGTSEDEILHGTNGQDIIQGREGADILYGYAGNDDLTANGNDILYAGLGSDIIRVNGVNNQVYGELGNDIFQYIYGTNHILDGGEGIDTFTSVQGDNLSLYGGTDGDIFDLGYATLTDVRYEIKDSEIFAGEGNDDIKLVGSFNTIYGGYGVDTLALRGNNNSFFDTNGRSNITLTDVSESEIVTGSENDEVRIYDYGTVGYSTRTHNNYFDLGEGDNTILGGSLESSTVITGDGKDLFTTTFINGNIYTGGGNDSVSRIEDSFIDLGKGDDTIEYGQNLTIITGEGKNTISAYNSFIQGAEGIDILSGSGEFYGGAGNDIFSGNGKFYGGIGSDTFTGSGELYGEGGEDTFFISSSNTIAYGGEGKDIFNYDEVSSELLSNITIYGGLGEDTISFTNAHLEKSTFNGGEEIDTISFYDYGISYGYTSFNGGFNTVNGDGGNDKLTIKAIPYFGNFGNNILNGGDGDDTLISEGYGNTLNGGEGNDILISGVSNTLNGGSGDDDITGGAGKDILDGGEGADKLKGGEGYDIYYTTNGDTITDFGDNQIFFNNIELTGKKLKYTDGNRVYYSDDKGFIYEEVGLDIVVSYGNEQITLKDTDIDSDFAGIEYKEVIIDDIGNSPFEVTEGSASLTGQFTSTTSYENSLFTYTMVSPIAGFTLNNDGTYSFDPMDEAYLSLAEGEDQILTVPVTVTDETTGATDSTNMLITITGVNNAPRVTLLGEQQVNSYTQDAQQNATLTTLSDGGYVVVWESGSWSAGTQDGDMLGVFLQKFDSNGNKINEEVQVNSYTSDFQEQPEITSLSDGGYVVTWQSYNQDGSEYGVYLQQFDSNGNKVHDEKLVNSFTTGNQTNMEISSLSNGGYVVTWISNNQDSDKYGVYLQQFDSNGNTINSETKVNTLSEVNNYPNELQKDIAITSLNNGGYVVAWRTVEQKDVYLQQFDSNGNKVNGEFQVDNNANGIYDIEISSLINEGYVIAWTSTDSSSQGIFLQQFDSNGNLINDKIQVNTYTELAQNNPSITSTLNGGYVLTWQSYEQDGSSQGIYLQQFDSNGNRVNEEQQVNSTTTNAQENPQIISIADGGYVVVWESSDGSGTGVYLQQFDSSGKKVNTEVEVNTQTEGFQENIGITSLPSGGYVVSWQSSDGDSNGIFLQQFNANGEKVDPLPIYNLNMGETTTGNLDYIKDPEGDALTYSANATNGIFNIDGNGIWSYTPNDGFSGVEDIIVTITESNGEILEYTITFNIDGTLYGTANNDVLTGTNSGETIYGYAGDDTLTGAKGDDTLIGGEGNDTYTFELGDGHDLINDYDQENGDTNTIIFGNGINNGLKTLYSDVFNDNAPDYSLYPFVNGENASDLTYNINDNNSITLGNFHIERNVHQFVFSEDNSTLILDNNLNNTLVGTDNADTFILSGQGNDTIEAGKGADTTIFGEGSNTLIFNRGDGKDILFANQNGNITFGEGITLEDIEIQEIDNKIIIGLKEDGKLFDEYSDTISMLNSYSLENITFNDGTTTTISELLNPPVNHAPELINEDTSQILLENEFHQYNDSKLISLSNDEFIVLYSGNETESYTSRKTYIQRINHEGIKIADRMEVPNLSTVESLEGGNFIVSWRDNDTRRLQYQLFDDNNQALNEPTQVGKDGYVYNEEHPVIDQLSNGNFIISYEAYNGGNTDIFYQIFTQNGNKIGSAIQANTTTIDWETAPSITPLEDTYIVTWYASEVFFFQKFTNGGEKVGDEISINFIQGTEYVVNNNGIIEIIKGDLVQDTTTVKRYDFDGNQIGNTITLNENNSTEGVRDIQPIHLSDGNFMILHKPINGEQKLYLKLFDTNNNLIKDSIIDTNIKVFTPVQILQLDDNTYLLSYTKNGADAGAYIQKVNANGEKVGETELVSNEIDNVQLISGVTLTEDGGYLILWNNGTSIYTNSEVMIQKFDIDGTKEYPSIPVNTEFDITNAQVQNGNLNYIQDPDGDTLIYSANATNGTFNIDENGQWNYTPANSFVGTEIVDIIISDGNGGVVNHILTFHVESNNNAPVIDFISPIETSENAVLVTGLITAVDVDEGAILRYSTEQVIEGFILNNDGTYSFDANNEAYQSLKKDEVEELNITVSVTDEYGAVDSKDLVITITGTNDTPTVEVIDASNINEDAAVINGQVEASDIDKDAVLTYTATTVAGFTLNGDGSYSFDASDEAYQHLAESDKETISIEVTISDENNAIVTTNIVFELTGTNDIPVVETLNSIEVNEDETVVVDTILASDVDDESTLSYTSTTTIAGFVLNSDGTYSFDAANESYQSLKVGEIKNFVLPLMVTDNEGAEVTRLLSIQITGTNDAPTLAIVQEHVTLKDELIKEGTLDVQDVDGTNFTYVVSTDVEHGSIIVDENGKWSYEVERSYVGDDRAVITVTDAEGATVDKTIEFTIDNNVIDGSNRRDRLRGSNDNDIISGYEGNDKLYGRAGNDKLYGGEGRDRLHGDSGSDELSGGTGNDYLKGGYGSDTYYFNLGDGNDTIKDRAKRRSSDVDKIILGEGITQDNIKVSKSGRDLIVTINEEDSIRIKYWFNNDKYKIETLEFADGNSLNSSEIDDLIIIEGTKRNDRLHGSNSMNDKIYGYAGNDKLYGYNGNDKLYGGEGKDSLYGNRGADALYGGTGNDYLKGGYGSDIYYFEQGDGEDTVKDKSKSSSLDTDIIKFGESVEAEDVSFIFDKRDLLIQYGDGDEIEVKYQTNDKYAIERVELADGNYLSSGDIDNIVQQIHAYADDNGLDIDSNQDIKSNEQLMQIIQGAWHQ